MEIDPANYGTVLLNAFSKQYREATDEWTNDRQMRLFPSFVHERLALPHATRVLDVGCGSGKDVEFLSDKYEKVVGIDIFPHDDWKHISQRVQNVSFECVDLLSYSTVESYDLILDNGCLHHQHPAEYVPYLRKIANLLHKSSYFVLSTFKNVTLTQRIDQNGRLHKYFSDHELNQELYIAGLKIFYEHEVFRPLKGDYYRFSFCRTG